MREAIAAKGKHATPDELNDQVPLARKRARDALRILERRGEYEGFAHRRPERYGAVSPRAARPRRKPTRWEETRMIPSVDLVVSRAGQCCGCLRMGARAAGALIMLRLSAGQARSEATAS